MCFKVSELFDTPIPTIDILLVSVISSLVFLSNFFSFSTASFKTVKCISFYSII